MLETAIWSYEQLELPLSPMQAASPSPLVTRTDELSEKLRGLGTFSSPTDRFATGPIPQHCSTDVFAHVPAALWSERRSERHSSDQSSACQASNA